MSGGRRVYILVLLCCVFVISANGERSASPGCRVRQFGKKLDCRGAGLSRIPKIYKGILIADFTDNLITHISHEDLKHLGNLQKVYLKGNPLHCDCNLERLRLQLARNNLPVIQDVESIHCKTPLHLHNQALKSLSDLCGKSENRVHDQQISETVVKRNAKGGDSENRVHNQQISEAVAKRNAQGEKGKKIQKCGGSCDNDRDAVCTETGKGSFACKCKKGYDNTTGACEDIDECKIGAHNCNEAISKCDNLRGSYTCACLEGYEKKQDKCIDKNECEFANVCGKERDVICKNTEGSFQCICSGNKKHGYKYSSEVKKCLDINECKLQRSPCDLNTTMCKNVEGGYSCECKPHFRKEGNKCVDIDECADQGVCKENKKCHNTQGSFHCKCAKGFTEDQHNHDRCVDIDECRTRGHNCAKQSYCRNTEASYTCECPKGFKNIGMKCSPTRLTRWFTPKYLLSDIKKGVWDSILVVCAVCVVAVALFVIFIVMLRKWCRKCAKKPEYEDQMFYPEEMYDPDQMFFAEADQMFYPEDMGYIGDEMIYAEVYPEGYTEEYPEGYSEEYPEDMAYPEGTDDPDVEDTRMLPMASLDATQSVPHTYYGDDYDELSDDNA